MYDLSIRTNLGFLTVHLDNVDYERLLKEFQLFGAGEKNSEDLGKLKLSLKTSVGDINADAEIDVNSILVQTRNSIGPFKTFLLKTAAFVTKMFPGFSKVAAKKKAEDLYLKNRTILMEKIKEQSLKVSTALEEKGVEFQVTDITLN